MQQSDATDWTVISDSYYAAVSAKSPYGEQIDEMLNRDQQINPHWSSFMQALNTLGLAEMGVPVIRRCKRLAS